MPEQERLAPAALVLDADTLPALAVIRSLGRRGIPVYTAAHTTSPIGARSRYSQRCERHPCPLTETGQFLAWLENLLQRRTDIALVIPVTERTVVPISRHFQTPETRDRIAVADQGALEQVLDKTLTAELASRCGVPQPDSHTVDTLEELQRAGAALGFPLVVKPRRSIASGDQRTPLTVTYAHDAAGLQRIGERLLPLTGLILQSYFRGDGIGVEVLAHHGEILFAFQHRRLHEVPLTGGGSSLRVSEDLQPELLDASRRLIAALAWHGAAMVEFKRQADTGEYILVEINGRLWGSLPLAVAAGADFPFMLWQLYTRHAPAPPPNDYRRGIQCRKLGSDLAWLEAVMRRDADSRLVTIPSRGAALRSYLSIFSGNHRFDAQTLDDPWPGLSDLGHIAARYGRRLRDLLRESIGRRAARWHHRRGRLEKQLGEANRILFLCYGNINRSALAHCLADSEPAAGSLTFRSAGFHPEAGRPADPRMAALAERHGLALSGFRSTAISAELVAWADIILAMEVSHLERLEREFPETAGKTALLGALLGGRIAAEIPDPYNQSPATYAGVYRQVEQSVKQLLATAMDTRGAESSHNA